MIKSKNTNIKNINYFHSIFEEIDSLENKSYESNLNRYTPEKIVSIADICLARATSLADEMLAIGKPTIIYDKFGHPRFLIILPSTLFHTVLMILL